MHTVRNRIASRSPITKVAQAAAKAGLADFKPPVHRASREELSLIAGSVPLAKGASPASSMALQRAPAGAPERSGESRPKKRRNPKGKKARKAAVRKSEAIAAMVANPAMPTQTAEGKITGRGKRLASKRRKARPSSLPLVPSAHPVSKLESGIILDLCLQAEPALALVLPSQPEPLVQAPAPVTQPQPEPFVRVLTLAAMPELLEETPAAGTELSVAMPAVVPPEAALPEVTQPEVTLAEVTLASAISANAQATPLARAHALVPARRQGLVDVIAFLLRDSGRRLARWSAQRHRSKAERETLRRAEARQRALVSELDALDALLRNRG